MYYSRLCMWVHILLEISLKSVNEALPIYSPTFLPFSLAPPSFSPFIYCRPWCWQLQQWFRDFSVIYTGNTIL